MFVMSVCVFIAANCPLPEVKPTEDYPLHINIDTNVVYLDFLQPCGIIKNFK